MTKQAAIAAIAERLGWYREYDDYSHLTPDKYYYNVSGVFRNGKQWDPSTDWYAANEMEEALTKLPALESLYWDALARDVDFDLYVQRWRRAKSVGRAQPAQRFAACLRVLGIEVDHE